MNRGYLAGILLATLAWPAVAQQKAPDKPSLNGIYPDMTRRDFRALYPAFAKGCRTMPTGRVSCMYHSPGSEEARKYGIPQAGNEPSLNTLAGEPVDSAFVTLDASGEKIFHLSFELRSTSFDAVSAALTQRFGKPSGTRASRVRNEAGAEFDQVETRWTLGTTVIGCEKRSGSMDMMKVWITSRAAMAIIEKEIKAMAAEGAKGR